jgi:hypothetical protein
MQDPMVINEDAGKSWRMGGIKVKWPMYEQSMLSYWIAISPYSLTPLAAEFTGPPNFIHEGAKKRNLRCNGFSQLLGSGSTFQSRAKLQPWFSSSEERPRYA